MKKDIQNREDVDLFVNEFYSKLLKDKNLKFFFEDIVRNNKLEHHLEIISDFWEGILFGSIKYQRNAMQPHLILNKTKPFTKEHFDFWLNHFNTTMNQYFKGEKAEFAKTRALSIATVMQVKMKRN